MKTLKNTKTRFLATALFSILLLPLAASGSDFISFYLDDIKIYEDGVLDEDETRDARKAGLGNIGQIQVLSSGNIIRFLDNEDVLLCERTSRGIILDEYSCSDDYTKMSLEVRKAGNYILSISLTAKENNSTAIVNYKRQ